jgi:hypothetical protein
MKPAGFEFSNVTLQPSGKKYSENVASVDPLPIWTDGEQCVSCWRMSWRERLFALMFGRVWVALLSGKTQPPIYVQVSKEYFKLEDKDS